MSQNSVNNHDAEKALRIYARLGLVAHGLVYTLMSLISLTTSIGLSRRKSEKEEAFRFINEQPLGKVVLFAMGVFMIGYVILRFFQAFKDTRHKGKGLRGIALRTGYATIGLVYLALSIYCFRLALDKPDNGDSKSYVKQVLSWEGGDILIGCVAAGFLSAAVYQVWRGLSKTFMKTVDLYHTEFKKTFTRLGVIGYTARGIVFAIIAFFFFRAAGSHNADDAEGTAAAFEFLRKNFGNWLMAAMSLGFLAFALFMFVRARHEKMSFDLDGKSRD
jgi:hypothetical protein